VRKGLVLYLIVSFLIGPLWPLFGQNPNEQLNSIEQRLQRIVIYSQKLEDELKDSQKISNEQQQTISGLLNELAGLRSELAEQSQELESSNASLESYRLRANELLSIISELETRLKQLSESFENTVQPLQEALRAAEKEIRRQKTKTVIWVILAAAAAGAAGYGIGQFTER
jgi:chromosome segregation ATPase